jgi:hypothetical protein
MVIAVPTRHHALATVDAMRSCRRDLEVTEVPDEDMRRGYRSRNTARIATFIATWRKVGTERENRPTSSSCWVPKRALTMIDVGCSNVLELR